MAAGEAAIEHPNRDKVKSQSTKSIVVALLLAAR
jgi:hypothetical protein